MRKHKISPAGEPGEVSLPYQTNPPRRILVVDEDPYICHLRADVLIRHGYEVNAAEDGTAAWEELQASQYNLLITDQQIPRVSGVELLKQTQAPRHDLRIIVVIRTFPAGKISPHTRLQPVATLLKPHTFETFLGIVKNILRETASFCDDSPPAWLRYAQHTQGKSNGETAEPGTFRRNRSKV